MKFTILLSAFAATAVVSAAPAPGLDDWANSVAFPQLHKKCSALVDETACKASMGCEWDDGKECEVASWLETARNARVLCPAYESQETCEKSEETAAGWNLRFCEWEETTCKPRSVPVWW